MTMSIRPRGILVAFTVLIVALATVAGVARQTASTSVPVCIKTNGQVRVLIGPTCDSSEQRTDWVIGGEITDITLGQGLIGSRENGTVQLSIDPSLVQACTGCRGGRIFSGFHDGPIPLPTGFPEVLARLNLPAGNFAITAKMTITNTRDEGFDDRVLCTLSADADFDQAELVLAEDVTPVVEHPYNDAAGLTLQVVHHFAAPGSVTLSCFEQDFDPDLSSRDLKIVAIEGSSLSNVFLGSQ
jgi:hypothetical protein